MTWADAKTQLTLQHGPKHRLKLWYLSTCRPDAKSRKPEMNQDHFGPKTITVFKEGYVCMCTISITNHETYAWEDGGLMLTSQSQQSKSFVPSTWDQCLLTHKRIQVEQVSLQT